MTQQNLFENYKHLIQAIWYCEENHLLTPALVMIYTAIDSVSWIAASSSKDSGKAFQKWVSEWMLKDPRIKCSAEELYAARCGVVHTLTPNSSMTQKGVRRIAYRMIRKKNLCSSNPSKIFHFQACNTHVIPLPLRRFDPNPRIASMGYKRSANTAAITERRITV
jgi:hypothetical protein